AGGRRIKGRKMSSSSPETMRRTAPPSSTTGERRRRSLPVLGTGAAIPRRPPGVGPPPRSVRISVTDRCDYACTYCRPSRHDGYADGRLLPEAWRAVFDGLRRAGVRRVRLTGGEPLLHPEIVAIVEHLTALGFEDVALTTNASQLERLAQPLRAAGLH